MLRGSLLQKTYSPDQDLLESIIRSSNWHRVALQRCALDTNMTCLTCPFLLILLTCSWVPRREVLSTLKVVRVLDVPVLFQKRGQSRLKIQRLLESILYNSRLSRNSWTVFVKRKTRGKCQHSLFPLTLYMCISCVSMLSLMMLISIIACEKLI